MRRHIRRIGPKGGGMFGGGRRRSVERRLRRHETVSIEEIVEAFLVLEPTPTGLVPADGSIETVRRKVAEVAAAHALRPEPAIFDQDVGAPRRPPAFEGAASDGLGAGAGGSWYLVGVADDADFVGTQAGVTIIRRVPGAVLACAPPEIAHRLRGPRMNVHVYDALGPAVAAFRLFEPAP